MILFEIIKLIICKKCDDNFLFNNKFYNYILSICLRKNIFDYFTKMNKKKFIIMIIRNFQFIMITRNSIKKFSSINFDAITNSFSITFDKFTNSFIMSFEFIIILSNTSKFFSINISIFLKKFKFIFVFIIVLNVDFNKNVDIDYDFRN